MTRERLPRLAAAVVAALVLVLVVNHFRGNGGPKAARPAVVTTTTAYVPAVVRGDPIPVVANPDAVQADRATSTLRGLVLVAPGAGPGDVMDITIYSDGAHIDVANAASAGVVTNVPFPDWVYLHGTIDALNAAIKLLRYTPKSAAPEQLTLGVANGTLHTNSRTILVTVQVV